jgi:TRAP-type C4-dicarboxylate transport system substrate-binding protein
MRALVVLLLLWSASAAADVIKLRFATVAPDGTGWAREMRAMSRDVAQHTDGAVELKWYFGGIAGDEEAVMARIAKGQLEGAGAGAICMRLAPSLRVFRVPGLFGNWGEALFVLGQLRPRLGPEFERSGFVSLGEGGFGSDIVFSRDPVTTLAGLQRGRFAVWSIDDVLRAALPVLGMHGVPMPIADAYRAFEQREIDGIISMPSPALAFQWSNVARYYTDLPLAFMPACLIVSRSVFDALSIEQQQVLRAAGTKFQLRINDLGQEQDRRLLGELFERQGLKRLPPSAQLRSQFLDLARRARDQLPEELIPRALISTVMRWLADYRDEYRASN